MTQRQHDITLASGKYLALYIYTIVLFITKAFQHALMVTIQVLSTRRSHNSSMMLCELLELRHM